MIHFSPRLMYKWQSTLFVFYLSIKTSQRISSSLKMMVYLSWEGCLLPLVVWNYSWNWIENCLCLWWVMKNTLAQKWVKHTAKTLQIQSIVVRNVSPSNHRKTHINRLYLLNAPKLCLLERLLWLLFLFFDHISDFRDYERKNSKTKILLISRANCFEYIVYTFIAGTHSKTWQE